MSATHTSWRHTTAVLSAALLCTAATGVPPATAPPPSIVELQPLRQVERTELRDAMGREGSLILVSLQPAVNAWVLVALQSPGDATPRWYHLENPQPASQHIALDATQPGRIILSSDAGTTRCTLWPGKPLEQARRVPLAYAPLCEGKLALRNAVPGNRTTLEATTEFLRDHVWRGEQIVGFVRREFFRDAYVEHPTPGSAVSGAATGSAPGGPAAAALREPQASAVVPEGLGIDIGLQGGEAALGRWYAAAGLPGVYVSVVQPDALVAAHGLDEVEGPALDYLVAFDLARFDLGFALGTEHPRLGWSARVPEDRRESGWPGPDGIADAEPLARTGMVNPALQAHVVATFTGGFKREHGAFRHGALANGYHGSHYGFIEQGVVFSTLQPGLSTLFVLDDGTVDLRTWRREDDKLLPHVRHARQNGVALVERGRDGAPAAGALVDQWGAGNWSGSTDERLRSLRAGACLVEQGPRRFLVYGYFSTATPRAMAQVFLAYGCRDAMHLDMNALEHTYLALYPRRGAHIGVEHLVQGMSVLDKSARGTLLPRFLGFADDRDFFYLLAKESR